MKALLIRPPSRIHVIFPPIGLVSMATCCENHDVEILDCVREGMGFDALEERLRSDDVDVVGLSAFSMDIASAVECCRIAKRVKPGIKTIIGGPHASNLPLDVLKNDCVDFVYIGEGEVGFPLFLDALEGRGGLGEVPGLAYDGKMSAPALVEELDGLPYPDWDKIDLKGYPKLYLSKRKPLLPIISSRGCPCLCTFCAVHQISGKKWRYRSPESFVEELKFYIDRYKVKEVAIWDDNFTLNRKRAKEICELMIRERLDVIWSLPNGTRLDGLDEELLRLMKESGCYSMAVGIESGSERIIKDMKKNLKLETVKSKIELITKSGIRTHGFFIIGYPTETREDVLKTIEFSKKLNLPRASFNIYQPLPGSESFNELLRDGLLPKDVNWSACDYSQVIFVPKGFKDEDEIKRYLRKALLGFYLRPSILFRFIIENLSFGQMKQLLGSVKTLLMHRVLRVKG